METLYAVCSKPVGNGGVVNSIRVSSMSLIIWTSCFFSCVNHLWYLDPFLSLHVFPHQRPVYVAFLLHPSLTPSFLLMLVYPPLRYIAL
ncbi:hypothetical protein F5Y06DRAFT_256764 [Hypoxylon sp. FL0890]|nr:hypothetical protein F5Y06DRAFT_256764 [Hypoxylon sp. FL0890]